MFIRKCACRSLVINVIKTFIYLPLCLLYKLYAIYHIGSHGMPVSKCTVLCLGFVVLTCKYAPRNQPLAILTKSFKTTIIEELPEFICLLDYKKMCLPNQYKIHCRFTFTNKSLSYQSVFSDLSTVVD